MRERTFVSWTILGFIGLAGGLAACAGPQPKPSTVTQIVTATTVTTTSTVAVHSVNWNYSLKPNGSTKPPYVSFSGYVTPDAACLDTVTFINEDTDRAYLLTIPAATGTITARLYPKDSGRTNTFTWQPKSGDAGNNVTVTSSDGATGNVIIDWIPSACSHTR